MTRASGNSSCRVWPEMNLKECGKHSSCKRQRARHEGGERKGHTSRRDGGTKAGGKALQAPTGGNYKQIHIAGRSRQCQRAGMVWAIQGGRVSGATGRSCVSSVLLVPGAGWLWWGAGLGYYKMFSSIPGLYPQDASSKSLQKHVCRHCQVFPWEKVPLLRIPILGRREPFQCFL